MVFRSLCSLYSTAYKMPLLSVHNILGRAGGVCAVLFTTTILRFYSAIKLLTSLFSLPLSFPRGERPHPVRLPSARKSVCAWAFVKISLRKGQKKSLSDAAGALHDHGTSCNSTTHSCCMISGERGATSASKRPRSSMSIFTHTYLTLTPARRRKRNSPESVASPYPRWELIIFIHMFFYWKFSVPFFIDHQLLP